MRQGRPEEAEQLLDECGDHPLAVAPRAHLALARGEPDVAAAILERRLGLQSAATPARIPLLTTLVEASLELGDTERAAAAADELATFAESLRRENLRGLASLAAADLASARGEDAVPALEHALALFEQVGMPYESAETRLRLARAFAAENRSVAIEQARLACTTFERLGARHRADAAAALLRSLGAPGRRPARAGELTGREREVLALLGEGLSNAEIARRLVISPKTAGHHVERIFRKLGFHARAEAAAYVVRVEPGGTNEPAKTRSN